jgi:hypothetical protein
MPAASRGGAAITVDPAALAGGAPLLHQAAESGRQAAAGARGNTCAAPATGSAELDAALNGYDGHLQALVTEVTQAADGLGDAVSSAAGAYAMVESLLMPLLRGPR